MVMGVTAWVSRMVGAPAVSQGTTAMLWGVAVWASQVHEPTVLLRGSL